MNRIIGQILKQRGLESNVTISSNREKIKGISVHRLNDYNTGLTLIMNEGLGGRFNIGFVRLDDGSEIYFKQVSMLFYDITNKEEYDRLINKYHQSCFEEKCASYKPDKAYNTINKTTL